MIKNKQLLYIVNFYGSPPLNYFEKYIRESKSAKITILKLPAVRLMKGRLLVDSFIIEDNGKKHEIKIDIRFPFFAPVVFFVQYLLNFILLYKLLSKVKIKKYDICIGETSFGSACAQLLKITKKVKFSIYMNGDILPDFTVSGTYYFNSENKYLQKIYKIFDSAVILLQMLLRKFGSHCDQVWYVTKKIRQWDIDHKIIVKNYFFAEAAAIDYSEFLIYSKVVKQKNTLGYIGRLDEFAGLDISIESLKYIRKEIPNIKFLIVGGGTVSVEHYQKIAKTHKVDDLIKFYGYVPEMSDAFDILSKASLGMALYKPDKTNISLATDVSKVKEYLKLGIPVIMAKGGPDAAKDVQKYFSGLVVEYDTKVVAKAIIDLFKNNEPEYAKLIIGIENHAKALNYKKHFKYVWAEILKLYEISH